MLKLNCINVTNNIDGRVQMNIIVCIKQVPGTNKVNVDPVTGTLIRDGVAAKMNPCDLNA